MSLNIFLLGQFKLQANNTPFELPSRPAQSLLAYLALNAGVAHRREKLASLLWPDTPEPNARSYLRQALWRIRKSLESVSLVSVDYLQMSDIVVCFDDTSDYSLDADRILKKTEDQSTDQLINILGLYRGELLPGFYEEWVVLERDRLQAAYHQKMNQLLEILLCDCRWDEALHWSEQWIRLGYSPEPAFRALMRAHAGLGDQTMISATYQRCVEALDRELGVAPSPETRLLYEQLLRREVNQSTPRPVIQTGLEHRRPPFLEDVEPPQPERPLFVARQHELAQLEQLLNLALTGQGRVVFVTGEAGSGKSALVQEFAYNAQRAHADLIIASGSCNAQVGIGDPYLPLREILGLLTGDVEARWVAGAITSQHARRLWNMLPLTARALVSTGPDLIDTFVLGSSLLERARAFAPAGADWLTRLEDLIQRAAANPLSQRPNQSDLFDQYSKVVRALASQAPLVLVLDDLQWADRGSISLLFHLIRRLAGVRIMVIGAYRPEEVALGLEGARHPLEPVVNELQREFGDITIDVDQAPRREFVEALLDSEPNQLGLSFRDMLYRQTRGHPLFTIELLRGLQERGDLLQDPGGEWRQGSALDWERLPARVEAAIAERIDRLPESLQAVLRAACVESGDFTAEVLARILRTDERTMVQRLSSELDRKHRLVSAQAIERLGERRVSRYRFRHYLFQKFLYDNLDEVERVYLHEDIGKTLEELFLHHPGAMTAIAPQLAHHFQEAGLTDKAIHYLHLAGERASQLSAYEEAITHLDNGLALLAAQPESLERDQQELALQISLGIAWKRDIPVLKGEKAMIRARDLCQRFGKATQMCQILGELSIFPYVRGEHQEAHQIAEEALRLAEQAGDPLLTALCHWQLGFILLALGDFADSHAHLQQVISFYKPQDHHLRFVSLRGSDGGMGALAYDACCLWCLGYPDQALQCSQEALNLAKDFAHAFTQADVLFVVCMFNLMQQDAESLNANAEDLSQLSKGMGFPSFLYTGASFAGAALARLGKIQEGIRQLSHGIEVRNSMNVRCCESSLLCSLVEAQALARQLEPGLATVDEAMAFLQESSERFCEAELHRLRGELLGMQGDESSAEASYHTAIEIARRQSARSWELRSTTSLARLWQQQGKTDEARQALAAIYNWFTEGFDTPDLIAAKSLLEELS